MMDEDPNEGIEMWSFGEQDFSMPSVTIPRRRPRRRRHYGRGFIILFLLVVPVYFYKQIIDVTLSVGPHTSMLSSPAIVNDYSNVRGVHDLKPQSVPQWCFRNVYDCKCEDPLLPKSRESDSHWEEMHKTNLKRVSPDNNEFHPSVVFYGDSFVELFNYKKQNSNDTIFDSYFSMTEKETKFGGIPLGIAGDTSPNLLWRIQKGGELPDTLHPRVFWINVGIEDLATTFCSPELVVIGVLGIVEEILARRTEDIVVINGIFPRGDHNSEGYVAKMGSVKPSLWPEIQKINKELKFYAKFRDERVFFFDIGKNFFVNPEANTNDLKLKKALMPDYFHLSEAGYKLWAKEIIKTLQTISKK